MAVRVLFVWLSFLILDACVREPYPPPEPPITVVFTTCKYDAGTGVTPEVAVIERDAESP